MYYTSFGGLQAINADIETPEDKCFLDYFLYFYLLFVYLSTSWRPLIGANFPIAISQLSDNSLQRLS